MSEKSNLATELTALLDKLPKKTAKQRQEDAKAHASAKADKRRAVAIERLERWKKQEAWNIQREASALALGLEPGSASMSLLDDTDKQCARVFDQVCRSVEAKALTVTNPTAPSSDWWVRPDVFAGWVRSRATPLASADVLDAFATVFPDATSAAGAARTARERFNESGYTTRALELAFEAIAELWLPFQEKKRPRRPTGVEVKEFLRSRGLTSENLISGIDALIRPDAVKAGGNLPSKGSTGKRPRK